MPAKGATDLRRVLVLPMTMTTSDPPGPAPALLPNPSVAVVFAGGDPLGPSGHALLRAAVDLDGRDLVVIAADSGLHAAQDGGWSVDLVIGDLDSVTADRLAAAELDGARVDRHPAAKAATDLELAIDAAVAGGADRVVVAGGPGGRFDHLLANVLLLGSDRFAAVGVSALLGTTWVHVVRSATTWAGRRGDLVTLLPLHGAATGVTTFGLLYPLDRATLHPGSTRGVSNEQLEPSAGVSVEVGTLGVVLPGEAGAHVAAADRDAPVTDPPP
jgi:thiamine pyrophosphokinase